MTNLNAYSATKEIQHVKAWEDEALRLARKLARMSKDEDLYKPTLREYYKAMEEMRSETETLLRVSMPLYIADSTYKRMTIQDKNKLLLTGKQL